MEQFIGKQFRPRENWPSEGHNIGGTDGSTINKKVHGVGLKNSRRPQNMVKIWLKNLFINGSESEWD